MAAFFGPFPLYFARGDTTTLLHECAFPPATRGGIVFCRLCHVLGIHTHSLLFLRCAGAFCSFGLCRAEIVSEEACALFFSVRYRVVKTTACLGRCMPPRLMANCRAVVRRERSGRRIFLAVLAVAQRRRSVRGHTPKKKRFFLVCFGIRNSRGFRVSLRGALTLPRTLVLDRVCTYTRSITLLTYLHTYANPPIFNLLCVFFCGRLPFAARCCSRDCASFRGRRRRFTEGRSVVRGPGGGRGQLRPLQVCGARLSLLHKSLFVASGSDFFSSFLLLPCSASSRSRTTARPGLLRDVRFVFPAVMYSFVDRTSCAHPHRT